MDKLSLIKHEAEKFVALSKKNKQELENIKIEQSKLDLAKEYFENTSLVNFSMKLSDLEDKKNYIIQKQDKVRCEIDDNKELKRQNIGHLKSIKEKEKKIELGKKQIYQESQKIISENVKINVEKKNIKNFKSVERATKELVVKQANLKEREWKLLDSREQLKEDRIAFRGCTEKGKQELKKEEQNLGVIKNGLSNEKKNLIKQKELQDKRAKGLLDLELATEAKLNVIKDKDADLASRELDLKNFIKRLKKEHGLKKLKKEGLL